MKTRSFTQLLVVMIVWLLNSFFSSASAFEPNNVDSILYRTEKYHALNSSAYMDSLLYCLEESKTNNYQHGVIETYSTFAQICFEETNMEDALKYTFKGLNECDTLIHKIEICKLTILLARIHSKAKNYNETIAYLKKGLKYAQQINDTNNILLIYGEIGGSFARQEQLDSAHYYYNKQRHWAELANNYSSLIRYYSNTAELFTRKSDIRKARKLFVRAIDLVYQNKLDKFLGDLFNNLAELYRMEGETDMAKLYYDSAFTFVKRKNDWGGQMLVLNNLGDLFIGIGKSQKAIDYLKEGLSIEQSHPSPEDKIFLLKSLITAYKSLNDIPNWSSTTEKLINTYDSLSTSNLGGKLLEINKKLDNEKNTRDLMLKESELLSKNELIKQQKLTRNILIGGAFILTILLVYIFKSYLDKSNANKLLAVKNAEISEQKIVIEEKNESILSSIRYAKNIQQTILPTEETFIETLPDSFVLYLPKDIVSGDFYWVEKKSNCVFVAVVDCTGHGVPGAFVSIVGQTALNRALNEFNLNSPSQILDKLNEIVTESFSQKGKNELKDGMDISLCKINFNDKQLEFAGANNPIYIARNKQLIEIKADKQPIGAFDNKKNFTLQTFQLVKDDTIYLFSDGYADQFGGPLGKKFKYSQFKSLLSSISHLPALDQKLSIEKKFFHWKSNQEQVDDVCVIGIKIS